jgi:ankyrin repeat protein
VVEQILLKIPSQSLGNLREVNKDLSTTKFLERVKRFQREKERILANENQGNSLLREVKHLDQLDLVTMMMRDKELLSLGDGKIIKELFIDACKNGRLDIVKHLSQTSLALVTIDRNYPAQVAAMNGHLETLKYLIENGAKATGGDNYPLKEAAENGHLNVVKYLTENGADIKIYGPYVFKRAAKNGRLDHLKYLLKEWNRVHLLETNKVNIVAIDSNYPLLAAATEGHLEVVKYLVGLGAGSKVSDDYAVQRAAENGHLETVKYLVDLGADERSEKERSDAITSRDNYALRWAAKNGHSKVVKYISSLIKMI